VGDENENGDLCGAAPDGSTQQPDVITADVHIVESDASDGGLFITGTEFKDPIIDTGAPANSSTLFNVPDQSASGPCLTDPQIGSLFPDNWLRPRFRYTPAQQENLFEIKLTMAKETYPLVIYTTKTNYTISKADWAIINTIAKGDSIGVTIRSAVLTNGALSAGPFMGSNGNIEIAPVDAAGSIVYWTTSGNTELKGFRVGDETVEPVLTPAQASAQEPDGGVACVGCHASTPDGTYVAFAMSNNINDGLPSYAGVLSADGNATPAPFVTQTANDLLRRDGVGAGNGQILPVFSLAHWTTGDRTVLTQMWNNTRYDIAWTDLETTSDASGQGWGILARNGDSGNVEMPTWSHDGNTVVYNSTTPAPHGTVAYNGALWSVPFNNRAGGTATQIPGANDSQYHYYYPSFSPDDKFLAFNRVASGVNEYAEPTAEVFVIPTAGGTATRLASNDPPACGGVVSPGISNSWPKWSPEAKSSGGNTYYFVVFSSWRDPDAAQGTPQLYLAPIVVDGVGNITSYPALYLWNQPEDERNHTPAWDNFQIPIIPPN
jgi:hypothetical protein